MQGRQLSFAEWRLLPICASSTMPLQNGRLQDDLCEKDKRIEVGCSKIHRLELQRGCSTRP